MQIHESAQDIEYHYTNLRALKKMMETDTFNMNDVEADKRGGPHMSLTRMRSSRSGYGWGMMNNAEKFGEVVIRIELDGRMLNNVRNINVRPYDYNYNEFRDGFDNEGLDFDSETMQMPQRMQILKYAQNGELKSPYNTEEVEAEDSLTLNGNDQIVDASNYITRIDVFLPSHLSESQLELWDIFLRRYLDDYPDWSEKMHFYNDVNAFDYQRDDKELPTKSLYSLYKQQYAQSLAETIVLTERDIRKMINETVRRILSEAISDREFHYTMLDRLCDMIETNTLHLSSAEEDNLKGKKFMSLTRNRSNQQGFQYGVYDQTEYMSKQNYARVEFDGRSLQNIRGARIKPYDYLYHEPTYDEHEAMNGKQLHQAEFDNNDWAEYNDNDPYSLKRQFYSQAEDRLTANEETIPNAFKYITKIDVMLRRPDAKDSMRFKELLDENPKWKNKVEIHMDNKSFNKPNGL